MRESNNLCLSSRAAASSIPRSLYLHLDVRIGTNTHSKFRRKGDFGHDSSASGREGELDRERGLVSLAGRNVRTAVENGDDGGGRLVILISY